MSKSLKKIIFHRGNIWNAVENTIQSLNNKNIHEKLKSRLSSNVSYVYEIDVINKYPFMIHHSPYELLSKSINLNTNTNKNEKYIYQLDHEDIINAKYYDDSKPIILEQLLEHCRRENLKVYLDIKHVKNHEDDIHDMIRLLNLYPDVIDCILSFSIELLSKLKANLIGIRHGLFIHETYIEKFEKFEIDDTFKFNFEYRLTKRQLKSYLKNYFETLIRHFNPKVLSIQKDLLVNDDNTPKYDSVYLPLFKEFKKDKSNEIYSWTFSQEDMRNDFMIDFLKTRNITPIFDNYPLLIDEIS